MQKARYYKASFLLKSHIYKQSLLFVVFLSLFLFSTATLFSEENKSNTKPTKAKETIISENTKEAQKPMPTPESTTENNPQLDPETLKVNTLEENQEQNIHDATEEKTHQVLQLLKQTNSMDLLLRNGAEQQLRQLMRKQQKTLICPTLETKVDIVLAPIKYPIKYPESIKPVDTNPKSSLTALIPKREP